MFEQWNTEASKKYILSTAKTVSNSVLTSVSHRSSEEDLLHELVSGSTLFDKQKGMSISTLRVFFKYCCLPQVWSNFPSIT